MGNPAHLGGGLDPFSEETELGNLKLLVAAVS